MERAIRFAVLLFLVSCEPAEPPASGPLLRPAPRSVAVPADALAVRVRSVYDGDTLTLEDGHKVRLLAVDTPELRAEGGAEPYSREAKEFTRKACEGREARLEFDVEKEDRYGRWLCYVYVREDGVDTMVNAELLRSGLARFYTPGANLRHADFLLACQREARAAGLGTWKDYVLARDKTVVATRSGHAYHREGCETLRGSKGLRSLPLEEALDKGLSPCRTCKP